MGIIGIPSAHHYIQLIRDLHASTAADGEDQAQKGTQLLEIYALEIQMYNETKNFKKLKVVSFVFEFERSSLNDVVGDL